MSAKRNVFQTEVIEGKIYAIGDAASSEVYDPTTDTWTTLASIPTPRSNIANVTSKGKVTALSKGLVLITAKDEEGNIIGRVYVRVTL